MLWKLNTDRRGYFSVPKNAYYIRKHREFLGAICIGAVVSAAAMLWFAAACLMGAK